MQLAAQIFSSHPTKYCTGATAAGMCVHITSAVELDVTRTRVIFVFLCIFLMNPTTEHLSKLPQLIAYRSLYRSRIKQHSK